MRIEWLQRYLPQDAFRSLGRPAVARVGAVIPSRVVGHLGLHGAFQRSLGQQLLQQTVFA